MCEPDIAVVCRMCPTGPKSSRINAKGRLLSTRVDQSRSMSTEIFFLRTDGPLPGAAEMDAIHAGSFGWTGMKMTAQHGFRDSASLDKKGGRTGWAVFACHWGRSIVGALLRCIAPFIAIFRQFSSWAGHLFVFSFSSAVALAGCSCLCQSSTPESRLLGGLCCLGHSSSFEIPFCAIPLSIHG